MNALLTVVAFVAVITTVIVVHEGGHMVVARALGVRVTEFFVGLPWGPQAVRRSPRSGIRYGASLALLGGYTRIAGMVPEDEDSLSSVMAYACASGRCDVASCAAELGIDEQDARSRLDVLSDWGVLEPVEPSRGGMARALTDEYRTVARDSKGLTLADRGNRVREAGGWAAGEPYGTSLDPHRLYEAEKSRVFVGVGVPKRIAILLAGIAVNLLCALIALVLYLCLHGGVGVVPTVAVVQEGSVAESIGISVGDEIVSVAGTRVDGAESVMEAVAAAYGQIAEIEFVHEGELKSGTADLTQGARLGIAYGYGTVRLPLDKAVVRALSVIGETGIGIAGLIVPTRTAEIVSESSGIVGIAQITSQAVSSGFWEVVLLWGLINLSLGWINLLPVLPLDGGKVVVEMIQAVIGRPVPMRVQYALTMLGWALMLTLFFVVTYQDIGRILFG